MKAVLLALALGSCGGPKMLEVRKIEAPPPPVTGPKATPEEVRGEVPALKGIVAAVPMVPEKLVPPEPPADPVPDWLEDDAPPSP